MPDTYLQEAQRFETAGADTSISEGTNITASSTANTKGSYTQLIASTGFAASGMLVVLGGNGRNNEGFLTDIAVGAAASEQVIVPDIPYYSDTSGGIYSFYLPVSVKAGVRLSARTQCSGSGTSQHRLLVVLLAGGFTMPAGSSRVTAYGNANAASRGTDVASSGSANTKGSWVEMSSATSAPMRWAVVFGQSFSATQILFDIGIGGSGSEQVLVPNLNIRRTPNTIRAYSFPLRVAKGTRLSARCAAANGSSTLRFMLLGIG